MATTATKVGPKYQVTIPKKVREAIGLKVGDLVEPSLGRNGTIILRPKVLVDRDPLVDQALEEAMADVKAGRVTGPFKSARSLVRAAKRRGRELLRD